VQALISIADIAYLCWKTEGSHVHGGKETVLLTIQTVSVSINIVSKEPPCHSVRAVSIHVAMYQCYHGYTGLLQVPTPDTYRGKYREDSLSPGHLYANEVKNVIAKAHDKGRTVRVLYNLSLLGI